MIVEGRDRRVDLHAPVIGEFLGDLGVDVAIGPHDEVDPVDPGAWRVGPRACRKPASRKTADRSHGQCAAQRSEEVAASYGARADQPSSHRGSLLLYACCAKRSYAVTDGVKGGLVHATANS